ncbi:MAG: prepilin-type N-terminal cleavage/methylation domain-containing protein [Candidatus Omnitrophica bacterium]|nr:prepilin-type N-terminal cleavage/methylation domain-containing protein [Candidatus Omnitrophota bacterium]
MTQLTRKRMSQRGFTLLELMIVIVIVALIAGFAVPRYTRTVERSRQGEALRILGDIRQSEFRYAAEYGTYANQAELTGGVMDIDDPNNLANRYFSYAIDAGASNAAFGLTATRTTLRAAAGVAGYTVTMDQDGNTVRGY